MKLRPQNTTSGRSLRTLKYVFSAIVLVMLFTSFLAYRSFINYGEEVKWRVHSDKIIKALQDIEVEVLNAEVGHRGYQLTKNPDYLNPYLSSTKNIHGKIEDLNNLILIESNQKLRVDTLENLISRQYAIIEEIVSEVKNKDPEEARFSDYEINLLAYGRQNMLKLRQTLDNIESAENNMLKQRISQQETQSKIVPIFFIISNLVALGIIIFVFFYIYRLLKLRIKTESELREKQIQLLEAERMVKIGNWSWDIETSNVEWSEGLYQIYEKSPMTFKPDYDAFVHYIHPEDRQKVLQTIEDAVEKKSSYELYFKKLLDNKSIKYVHSIGNPKLDLENNLVGYFGVTQDVTEQRNYQNQILQQSEELKRSNQDLEQFAYVASHDLQEPLRKIRAFGDRLETKFSDKLEETGVDYINRMQNAAERMQVLINDLLAFSRVSRKDQEFKKHDLTGILEEVIEDLETKINESDAQVKYDRLPSINCNNIEMKRLFQNIIANGLKFKKPDVPPVITITSEIVKGSELKEDFHIGGNKKYVKIRIKDNGIGFQKKYKERIFNIFQRLHGRSEYKGTGIGLAICRKIVANHEGHITAKGEENKGAEFIIVLPKNLNKIDHERTKEIASNFNG